MELTVIGSGTGVPSLRRGSPSLAVKAGGRLLVMELAPHAELWVREKLGHVWLGFTPQAVRKFLDQAGFTGVAVEPAPGRAAVEPFKVLVATGVKA